MKRCNPKIQAEWVAVATFKEDRISRVAVATFFVGSGGPDGSFSPLHRVATFKGPVKLKNQNTKQGGIPHKTPPSPEAMATFCFPGSCLLQYMRPLIVRQPNRTACI
jgi:hypothetical protein